MKGAPPLKGAVSFKIAAHFPIAASASQKKREDMLTGEIPMTKKPDLDNVIKACLDGVNEIAFVDDAQVICIKAAKLYSEAPRLEVKIEKIGGVELALMWFRDVKNNLLDAVIGIKAEKWD
jgi:Holliday junction resolvase RusA-like endonuclease